MNKQEQNTLAHISRSLDEIAKTEKRIADVIERQQPGKVSRLLTLLGTGAGILGVLSAVEIIRVWIFGK